MKTILSIQSHVAYGYVGNRCAAFVLQRLGFDVIVVNTVQFSNHTGYGAWTGQVFPAEHIRDLIDGLEARGALARCDAVLSGYLGDAAIGECILDALGRIRRHKPEALYCCDPVMGDYGRGYFVRPGIPEFFGNRLVPAAGLLVPNAFELNALTGLPVDSVAEVAAAAAAVRALGPRQVLVTGLRPPERPDKVGLLLDTAVGTWFAATPWFHLDPLPNGAGDAVAALFLAQTLAEAGPEAGLARIAGAIHAVFAATHAAGTRELQLVAAQGELADPGTGFIVERLR